MGLSPAGAYIPEHLRGESTQVQKSNLQREGAILLHEDGTPRCRIGKLPSEDLGIGLDGLDALEECDEGDELYTRTILGSEEISLGMAAPSQFVKSAKFVWEKGRLTVPVVAIGFSTGCLPTKFDDLLSVDMSKESIEGHGIAFLGFLTFIGGFVATIAYLKAMAASNLMRITLIYANPFSAGAGLIVCADE